jgi:mannose-1-phosphate guanylyltransferase
MPLHAVIMAGGSGTRFWPASRKKRPKQFLPLARGQMLLRATLDRTAGLCDRVCIVTSAPQAKLVHKLVPDFPRENVIVEPEPRDTAPCLALATATIGALDADAKMVVLPADHVIEPTTEFHRMVRRGAHIADDGETLVTFGCRPRHAATGFGYIECGAPLDGDEPRAFRAVRFREKPDEATARQFLEHGGFLWNSGIFVWTVAAIRRAMRAADPALAAVVDAPSLARARRAFRSAPSTSIDYAVLEKAPRVAVVEATAAWHDVGTFAAIAAVADADGDGNATLATGGASAVTLQSHGNIVYAEGKRTVALFGVDDLVVVAVGDAVLVCPKHRTDELKKLIDHMRATGRTDLL